MTRWEKELLDPFLAEIEPEEVDPLVRALEPSRIAAAGRAALLSRVSSESRFERFVAESARLLDLPEARARGAARSHRRSRVVVCEPARPPHRSLRPAEGPVDRKRDHRVCADARGIRLSRAPPPRRGERPRRPGELPRSRERRDPSSRPTASPSPRTPPTNSSSAPGPDLVYLAVVQNGIQVGEHLVGPNDPGM